MKDHNQVVPVAGLEPARCHHRGILNPLRLPFRHTGTRDMGRIPPVLRGVNGDFIPLGANYRLSVSNVLQDVICIVS